VKRLQYDRYGGPEVMRLAEFEPPRPGPDEVLVRVRAAASNTLDWKMRNGEILGIRIPALSASSLQFEPTGGGVPMIGFYRVCVIDQVLPHSPADYGRRPPGGNRWRG